jgi:dolichyl-phosphate beta-glucosyltransferase
MTAWWGPARSRLPEIRSIRVSPPTIPLTAVRAPVDVEVVIPAFNESSRLPMTLAAMVNFLADRSWSSRVVVVDNGSYDDTAAVARSVATDDVEVIAIGCAEAGKGASVLRGLRTSSSRFVGFTDADLSTPLATLLPAVAALEAGAAAAIASRHAPGSTFAMPQPLGRRLGGQVFRTVARPLVPGVHDTQCGFKFFDRVRAQSAITHCRDTGFAFDVELLRQIQIAGGRIVEIPVTWTDDPHSTLRPVRDGFAAIAAVSRMHRRIARADVPGSDAR